MSMQPPPDRQTLRDRARERMRNVWPGRAPTSEDVAAMMEELVIHQVELELQNEELRRTQEALVDTGRQAEFLFHHAPVGYVLLDGRGVIHRANETFVQFVALEPRLILGRGLVDFIAEDDRGTFHGRFRSMYQVPAGKSLEVGLRSGVRVLMDMARPEASLGGLNSESLLLVTMTNVTEFRRIEEEQRQIEKQLQTAQKMESLGALAGGVAYEMNNILGAILGVAELQMSRAQDPPMAAGLETIQRVCLRGRSLVQRLLRMARRGVEELTEVDLNVLVKEVAAILERTTLRRVDLVQELDPSLPRLYGDADALSHALLNLGINAVDAMPEGGELVFRTQATGEGALVEVRDTGVGMCPDVLERATDPFFTTKSQGTGLGLALVYSTIKAHGGRVEIQSEVGCGTVVTLHLPLANVPESPRPLPEVTSGELRPLTLLVLDDEELIRTSLCEMLIMDGHRVSGVASGEEALEILGRGEFFDCVILDLNMPGLGGEETLRRVKALLPTMPVLLDTGRADQEAMDLCAAYPGVRLLPKPFTWRELLDHLAAIQQMPGMG